MPENQQSREAWLTQRKERLPGSSKIKITLRNIKVNIEGDKASAEFTQLYVAPGYSDSVTKQLQFERIDNRWMIVREAVK